MFRAVLWDFGGVIVSSPFAAFDGYERANGLPEGFLRAVNAANPDTNAWARLERDEIAADEFDAAFATEFPDTFRTAMQIREEIARRGWTKVVAFQTRNPMHRAHEELCRMAMERLKADGIVVHMLLGKLKAGDIPANVRNDCINKMVELYFPKNTVMVTGYGFDMLYAGPREAVLHAIFRQNMGATHLIVGRDHAGVGSYYGPFDAQAIFEKDVPKGSLEIQIFAADNTAWSKKLGRVVMKREAAGHTDEDYIDLSGTKVREMLGKGIAPPPEFSRPEVAKVLMDYYKSIGG